MLFKIMPPDQSSKKLIKAENIAEILNSAEKHFTIPIDNCKVIFNNNNMHDFLINFHIYIISTYL